jgi:hypothetical protein
MNMKAEIAALLSVARNDKKGCNCEELNGEDVQKNIDC